jgi:hypothetical protein
MYNTLNKQTSFFVALSLVLVLFSTCQKDDGECSTANIPTIDWQKTIGDNNDVAINDVQQTTDGGYILAGYKAISLNNYDYWIVKLNSNADIEWEKTYGGSNPDEVNNIQQTTDGGYIVAGLTFSYDGDVLNNKGNSDAWILKLSTNGDIEWQKTYGGSFDDGAKSIQQTADNGYIAVGYTISPDGDIPNNQGSFDAWIIKIATNGNLEWSKTFGGTYHEQMNDIQQTIDDGYLTIGETSSDIANNHGGFDVWVIKINLNGNMLWQKTYGGSKTDRAKCVQKTNDGYYIIIGYTESSDGDITNLHGLSDAWVIKIDDLGNISQQTTLATNGNEDVNSVLETHDNNFLIAGISQNTNSSINNIFIAMLDTDCNLLWQRQIPQENNSSSANAIFETTDCGYMLFGGKTVNGITNTLIIKLK